ncbi:glycerol-3-phosphate dehydrogenase (NAD(P)+) [Aliiroseovarius crassostreae]|uniref:Glycerol-3-phosphate dehydrogenase [NAD(P)+] n=1 Tax=Aliiroseovarius crassostreae TaxID=154981 RepID=A0A0P7JNM0_9RHOB|nr:NAD(P)H-dependent glycerol-3-phosphate dehydrogenase [Aliiroseovarius crassostreae]KPN62752.1 glycerol-3-phosphate dehydrogenase [Aliiroseovarius crassostreae]SFU88524.1 glycerol-3-phosphate dehydrogenase (NAD(P)+) [Aliiroseovarius crassostreae]
MSISVLGAGAFGTALAISLANENQPVTLWARDPADMQQARENKRRLPGVQFPARLTATADLNRATEAKILLLAVPMQKLSAFLQDNGARLSGKTLVACCKGIDLATGLGPAEVIRKHIPDAQPAILSGPSFAVDIAGGLPTALTLATENGKTLQQALSTRNLRIYRSSDLIGVEIGGALKNVVAIACGIAIGAGLGESARAALMTRGYAEMQRFAVAQGSLPETLAGLSGFGDLALTCASEKSRNFAFGFALGRAETLPEGTTVEGKATAKAVAALARDQGIDMPIAEMIVAVLDKHLTIKEAVEALLARPLKEE